MVKDILEVFKDDFYVFGDSLSCAWQTRVGLCRGIKVDKVKVEVIEKLPPPISVKGEAKFAFDDDGRKAFECLMLKLVEALIINTPDWMKSVEIMCNASGVALGAVLKQKNEKLFHSIYYGSKDLNGAQKNYTVTKQELLAAVYAYKKYRAYFLGTKVVVHTDRAGLRYLIGNMDAKPRLIRWVVKDKLEIDDTFLNEKVLAAVLEKVPWYADFANYIVNEVMPENLSFY
ncbi:uncharacterized protein LOC124896731 [Capsicum annuum]|uniref:uncharacterized protein LOC124896731 n=1 Tax=Capsicum annuum TaxID=4072 RepID=UPI001FB17FB0|nr:uncharacterized protein LOC124896731 [Capsicum annuum]